MPFSELNLGDGVTAVSGPFCAPFVDYDSCVIVDKAFDTVRQ